MSERAPNRGEDPIRAWRAPEDNEVDNGIARFAALTKAGRTRDEAFRAITESWSSKKATAFYEALRAAEAVERGRVNPYLSGGKKEISTMSQRSNVEGYTRVLPASDAAGEPRLKKTESEPIRDYIFNAVLEKLRQRDARLRTNDNGSSDIVLSPEGRRRHRHKDSSRKDGRR